MSAFNRMWRMCDGKERYDEAGARARATRLNAQRHRRGPMIKAYPCSCCPYWHVGGNKHTTKEIRRGGV